MKSLIPSSYYYTLSPNNRPKLRVNSGETILVETIDATGGKIRSEKDLPTPDRVPLSKANPQSGPIFVENSEIGDTLIVKIIGIEVTSVQGITVLAPNFGGLVGNMYTRLLNDPLPPKTRICPIEDGVVKFSNSISIPLEPMIGTIGVSPESEAISSLTSGPHGGNMDCPDICVGNKLLLPVLTKGALLHLGDVHAVQGDGEISGSAIDVSAKCTIQINLQKKKEIRWPRIESKEYIMTIGNCRPLEDAIRIAFVELIDWLNQEYKFNKIDAYQLCSQVAKLRVAQVVDPAYTVAVKFPKKYLPKI